MAGPAGGAGPQWTSRFGFLMAAIGCAIGLGNLWRFPFQAGQNGGSAFVLIYLLCVFLIALPILIAEIAIGRHKGLSAVGSTRELAKESGHSALWGAVGLIGILASYMVLTTYSVVAGQILSFSLMSFSGVFASENTGELPLYADNTHAVLWHGVFIAATMAIVARGLKDGVERMVTILMPVFFIMLAGLGAYSLSTGAAGRAIDYLFAPRFDQVTAETVLAALGQAFYSIAVGSAAMITYGAYLNKKENISTSSIVIVSADTIVALLAGLMIFPIVFAFALDPAAGMGLIFDALPQIFAGMPGGQFVGGFFFFLAFIAALTTSISMLLITVVFVEEVFGIKRMLSVAIFGALAFGLGAVSIITPGMAENIDYAAGSIFLPLSALGSALLAGWIAPRAVMRGEIHHASEPMFRFWRFFVRYLAPIAVILILLLGIDARFDFGLNRMLSG
ncbi:sodium-dependent transporter [Hyphococcus flavus]|uniref:Sodium-dependent transporter n=1 Tax=Hyphococcus flavus TaxID=1866326 RepID=A0AAE9ZEI1_9PROT|nr:sodium-dependent transporter [Hyphococcus flavus]WDI31157.1 sodium-dependent transporter [Hyphococcus flavus]